MCSCILDFSFEVQCCVPTIKGVKGHRIGELTFMWQCFTYANSFNSHNNLVLFRY